MRLVIGVLAVLALASCAGPSSPQATESAEPAGAPVALFVGDSYTVGLGLSDAELDTRWSSVVAAAAGWDEINAGCSGSGYSQRGPQCPDNYRERVATVADTEPDLVIVSGGVNDLYESADIIDARVHDTFAALRDAFPSASIYAVNSIYFRGDETPEIMRELNESVERWADSVDATYLDIGEPLLGHPELLGDDGVHPNPAGHAVIADVTQAELAEAGAYSPG